MTVVIIGILAGISTIAIVTSVNAGIKVHQAELKILEVNREIDYFKTEMYNTWRRLHKLENPDEFVNEDKEE